MLAVPEGTVEAAVRSPSPSALVEMPRPHLGRPPVTRPPWTEHLIDLALQTSADGLQDGTGRRLGLREVAELVVGAGGRGCDVRILTGGGQRCLGLLQELADELWCDVYVPPEDAMAIEWSGDFMAVDTVAREPVDWIVVRPSAVTAQMPLWFDRSHGRVRLNKGLVTLPLADGLAFATRSTFLEMAAFAGDLALGTEGLTPIAAVVHSGRFAIAWYEGPEERLGGEEFGRLVAASLDGPSFDVQLAIAWPANPAEREQFEYELFAMADVLDRTVWVPEPGCSATTARTESGHIELVAADADGGPAQWHPYASSAATGHYLRPRVRGDGPARAAAEAAASTDPRYGTTGRGPRHRGGVGATRAGPPRHPAGGRSRFPGHAVRPPVRSGRATARQ